MSSSVGLPACVGFLILVLLCPACFAARSTSEATAIGRASVEEVGHVLFDEDNGQLRFVQGLTDGAPAPARGSLSDASRHKSNFGQLRVVTDAAWSDKLQMRAAGFLEGWMTAVRIYDHWTNYRYWFEGHGNGTEAIVDWLVKQDQWTLDQLHARSSSSSSAASSSKAVGGSTDETFWDMLGLVMDHLGGLVEGYNARVVVAGPHSGMKPIRRSDFLLMNAFGDMNDLLPMLMPSSNMGTTMHLDRLSPEEAKLRLATTGHCSVLIRVTGDLSDIVMGHTTWSTYYTMVRIYKHYSFALSDPRIKGPRMSMSSYPGVITSIDDFFVLSSGLVVTETTNDILDMSVYDSVVPESVISYNRVRVANMLAGNGAEWAEWVKMHNSGTYNNQYMVVDMKRFEPGHELKPGLLTVTELLPGFSVAEDLTRELERGFWPSYNVPYFQEIYNRSGFASMSDKLRAKGPAYAQVVSGLSYQLAPRAKIFRRDAGSVSDLASLSRLLRSNEFGGINDTYTEGSPFGTICARGDLNPGHPTAYGCLDAKVTSYRLALEMSALAVGGPSDENGLPPFSWSKAAEFAKGPHHGMLDTYTSKFELQKP